jgi:hypothetical protein
MDIFVVLTVWVYFLFALFTLNAIASAVARAINEVFGVTAQDLIIWGIKNPLWLYAILDRVAPQATPTNHHYFGGISND